VRFLINLSENAVDVAWSPDGRLLAFEEDNYIIRIWDAETNQSHLTFGKSFSKIVSLAWSPNGRWLAVGYADGLILLWDVKLGREKKLQEHTSAIFSLSWSPDGKLLASGSTGGTVRLWDIEEDFFFYLFDDKQREIFGSFFYVTWSHDGQILAASSNDGSIRLWDAKTKHLIRVLEGHQTSVTCLSFSSDGRLLASRSFDKSIRLWSCDTWETVSTFIEDPASNIYASLSFHPHLPVLATSVEGDRVVNIWRLDVSDILSASPDSDSVHYTTARITLVGDSGVGKTGLGWRLAHGKFKDHPSTHGQQFWVINEFGVTRKDGAQCEAVLWDLAGQPDYRLVHALFLDDVDVALVLFDPANRQEPLKGVEYWLKQLSRARRDGRGRRVILVGARADRGVPTLTREELEEFCRRHGVEAYVGTSALTGEGLAELMERVKASIVWEEMPATVTTKTFKRVKEFVLGLKEDGGRKGVLVSPADLRARLEATDAEWEFTDAEMMTAVRHLSNHGYVSVLRGSSGEESILLAPDLLANLAASFVLEARRNPRGLGALDEARVLEGGYEFPEFVGLDERERDVLLDAAVALFIEHNICFRETLGAQTFLIFPALINQKRPQLEVVETEDDFSYRVTGAVENVYAALVVQLGYTNTFTRTNQWQNQAEYETARGDVCGFRQADEREGEIELVLYHAKEHTGARLLFQGLFEEFLRSRDVSITKFPPVGCPKCGYRQQRDGVIKRITEGKGFLYCSDCGKKVTLPKAGDEVALSRPDRERLNQDQERTRRRTEFETALVRVKGVVRDEKLTAPSCFVSYAWGDEAQERWVRGLAKDLENAGVAVILDRKDNPEIGRNIARFIERIEQTDFVAVVGTPLYKQKYENKVSDAGSVVAAEVDLINLRLIGTEAEKATVLPLLLAGDDRAALPPLIRGRRYENFQDEGLYFASLFDLILTLYRIPFEHPAVSDLRDSLRAGAERRR
jgi:small GTP-binding protein